MNLKLIDVVLYVWIFKIGFAIAFSIKSGHIRRFNSFVSDGKMHPSHLKAVLVPIATTNHVKQNIQIQESDDQRKISDTTRLLFAARVIHETENNTNVACQGILLQEDVDQNPLDFTIHISSSNEHFSRRHDQLLNDHIALVNTMLLRYLELEEERMVLCTSKGTTETRITLQISFDDSTVDASIVSYLESIGMTTEKKRLPVRLSIYVPFLHQYSFHYRGTNQGKNALVILKQLSQRRIPFQFESHKYLGPSTLISHQKQILSPEIVEYIMKSMEKIKANHWLSTNPDSVDGIASLHINLISGGKELFHDDHEINDSEFTRCVTDLTKTVKPHLDQHLLPRVRELTQSNTVEISDVFLRNYGKDNGEEDPNQEETIGEERVRYKLSSHYDITSFATCVMALDDVAIHGTNGLYTISTDEGLVSTNHAALRQFFPLMKGDGVIHTYDVLHGVDVHPSLNQSRTSLIVWFVDHGVNDISNNESSSLLESSYPWLLHPKNDVHEFILALATDYDVDKEEERNIMDDAVDKMYIKSMKQGNSFALNAMAQRIDDGVAKTDSDCMTDFTKWFKDHAIDHANPFYNDSTTSKLSQALWYESAMLGNVNAQISLADDVMMGVMKKLTDGDTTVMTLPYQKDQILIAAVLFTMASVQGIDVSSSLEQIMSIYRSISENTRDDWEEDEVIQTLLLTL